MSNMEKWNAVDIKTRVKYPSSRVAHARLCLILPYAVLNTSLQKLNGDNFTFE